jgi:hypothetical protein
MAGGAIFPASMYLGAASGVLYPAIYTPSSNTSAAGYFEGIGCAASPSSGSTYSATLQYNLPESLPSGVAKLRILSMANATSGVAKITINDAVVTAPGSSPGVATLITETQISQTWSTADVLVENKVTLGSTMVANSILTVRMDFNSTGGFSLAAASVHQASLVWE